MVAASRALGALLCAVTVVVAVLHLYFGYIVGDWAAVTLSFALPVTVGVLTVCVLGFWLGWIMATTKEVSPPPTLPESEKKEAEE